MTKYRQFIKNSLRTFFLSSQFLWKIKKHISGENFQKTEIRQNGKSHTFENMNLILLDVWNYYKSMWKKMSYALGKALQIT